MNAGLPVVIVLAAGPGARFAGEGHKLEQRLGDRTVLEWTVGSALASGLRTVVVCRDNLAPIVRRMVAVRDMVLLTDKQQGIGSSIAAGVQATSSASGWIFLPGDMPLVRAHTLRSLSAALMREPVVVAEHHGRRGYPVGFGAELYSELVALKGEAGPKRLMARFSATPLAVEDAGVLIDVDTVADLDAVRQRAESVTPSGFGELPQVR